MNYSTLKDKVNQLSSKFDLETAEELIEKLNSMTFSNKNSFTENCEIYRKLGVILLENSVDIRAFNLSTFQSKFSNQDKSIGTVESIDDDPEILLKKFLEEEKPILRNLKGFFIFTIELGKPSKTNLLFLHDEHYKSEPHIKKFRSDFPEIEISSINDFDSSSYQDKRFIVILYIPEIITLENNTFEKIKDIVQKFGGAIYYELDNELGITKRTENELLEQVKDYSKSIFNNTEFTQEEEILIKRLSSTDCSILNYRKLKSGFSGSKVIEVQALKPGGESIRKVIKIDKISLKKIKEEENRFRNYVDDYVIAGYSIHRKETSNLEAISYNYASIDGYIDSYSFSDMIDKMNNFDIPEILKKIFDCNLLKTWENKTIVTEKNQIKNIYANYINLDHTYQSIVKIRNNEKTTKDLLELINRVLEMKIEYKSKICHGDFHTQNIFIDSSKENNISIIDFGWTDFRHAVIDHVFLECSIKYNHIPKYISVDELLEIEERLLNKDSFKAGFDLSFIKRVELRSIYEWVLEIRRDALQFLVDGNKPMEYFISLLIISFRMIGFRDLYQLFALELSEKLASFIIQPSE